jgi:glucose/arabinose dehydrogenase
MKFLKRLLAILGILAAVLVLGVTALVLFVPGLHLSSLTMILNVMTGRGSERPSDELLARLEAADGYRVSVFARDLPNPRMLARDDAGHLLVSNPRAGSVIMLVDEDGDGAADNRTDVLEGLTRPHGLAFHDGYLYVAESNQVGRAPWDADAGRVAGDYQVVTGGFTDEGNHWTKSIAFGPDGFLYVAMGSTCNVCEEEDPRRATIMRFTADGADGRIYASGLRNSVGLAFAPDGRLYATDNGRDLLGDDFPPCELNLIVEDGFYGWPYFNGDNVPDPDFGSQGAGLKDIAMTPVYHFRAHNAPLGIYFSGEREALVALHGSWNRSTPDGYKVVKLRWREDGDIEGSDFLWGFERNGDIVGRPVDVVGDGAGGFFVSDDYARVIYRLSRAEGLASADAVESDGARELSLDPALAQAGSALFEQLPCGECHDPGAATPVPLDGLAQKYDPASLADYFLAPTPPMPKYPLSDQERLELAHYLLNRE